MIEQINIKVKWAVFSVFVVFLIIAGIGTNNSGITGFSVRDREKGDEWIVIFTGESGDLVIEMQEGSGYSSIDDIEFLELRCGDSKVIPNVLTNRIVYENYSCEKKSHARFIVNSEENVKQKLGIGNKSRMISFKR